VCYDKGVVRGLATSIGIPVPREQYFESPEDALARIDRFPVLIKPNQGDGSVGITKDAVVRSRAEMRDYLDWLRATLPGRDALVQEYLPGAEYGLGLIGNPETALAALPALEVDYARLPKGLAPILSYESKALPDSPYWTEIKFKRAGLTQDAEARLAASAQLLFARLGLRDYARFDFRVGADGVVEVEEGKTAETTLEYVEGMNFDKLIRALLGVMFFSSAYMAEVVRGGLQALPKGQYEAAQALGLNYWKMMALVILPQALKMVIPGIVNTFIGLFKDTTLVLIIGLFDFLGMVQLAGTNPDWLGFAIEGYVFTAFGFWVFCFSMSRYSQSLERKLATGHKR